MAYEWVKFVMVQSRDDGGGYSSKMEDDSIVWQRFAQRGRVLMGVMRSLDVRLTDIGAELDVSQGHLSSVLNTYPDLDVTKCRYYFEKVEIVRLQNICLRLSVL